MATVEILESEARERPRMAVVAFGAAVFTLAAGLVGRIVAGAPPSNLPAWLLFIHDNKAAQYASTACSAIGVVAMAVVLDFLYRAAKARNAELPGQLRPLPWIGGVGSALVTVVSQVALAGNADHFATQGSQTYEEARKVIDAGVPPLIGVFLQLALAAAIVMISVNAMRVGLLTRFLGYLGVISAVLFVIPLFPIPIVQVYWIAALGMLFIGRTPTGTPPAWQSGEAMPWPSPAEMREQRVREAEARRGGGGDDVVEGSTTDESASTPAKRKKRKRR